MGIFSWPCPCPCDCLGAFVRPWEDRTCSASYGREKSQWGSKGTHKGTAETATLSCSVRAAPVKCLSKLQTGELTMFCGCRRGKFLTSWCLVRGRQAPNPDSRGSCQGTWGWKVAQPSALNQLKTPPITAFWRWKQEDCSWVQISCCCIVRHCFKKQRKTLKK